MENENKAESMNALERTIIICLMVEPQTIGNLRKMVARNDSCNKATNKDIDISLSVLKENHIIDYFGQKYINAINYINSI